MQNKLESKRLQIMYTYHIIWQEKEWETSVGNSDIAQKISWWWEDNDTLVIPQPEHLYVTKIIIMVYGKRNVCWLKIQVNNIK